MRIVPEALLSWLLFAPALAGWVEIADGKCVTDHPDLHRLHLAQDQWHRKEGMGEVEAAVKARAKEELLAEACAERDKATCAQIRQRVGVESVVDRELRLVCAAAVVASEVVEDPAGLQSYQEALDKLAGDLAAGVSGPVWVASARWHSGCGAGDVGNQLGQALRGSLVTLGLDVRQGAGTRLVPVLTAGPMVGVEVRRFDVSGGGFSVAGSASLSGAWLGLHDHDTERCVGDARLGLSDGARSGAGGLSVELDLEGSAELCSGDVSTARLRPSRAAHVQLWSVGRTGDAWLTWSSQEMSELAGAPLDRRATLDMEAAWIPELGEETLVALAVEDASKLPIGTTGCRNNGFSLSQISGDAAVATAPFTVLEPGRGACSAGTSEDVSWEDYVNAPACR